MKKLSKKSSWATKLTTRESSSSVFFFFSATGLSWLELGRTLENLWGVPFEVPGIGSDAVGWAEVASGGSAGALFFLSFFLSSLAMTKVQRDGHEQDIRTKHNLKFEVEKVRYREQRNVLPLSSTASRKLRKRKLDCGHALGQRRQCMVKYIFGNRKLETTLSVTI